MSSKSLIDTAYSKIRNKLILGDYMPGTLLSENELAEKLGMSRTPIRTAISRLESEGFLKSLKNRGVLVVDISYKEMLDLFEINNILQINAIDSIIERDNDIDLNLLKEHLDLQLEASRNDHYHDYVKQSILFSRCIVSASNNYSMLKIIDSNMDKMVMFAIVNYKLTPHQRHYSANDMNKKIYQALVAGNYESAKELLKEFFTLNRERFMNGRL
jgi:DNA-binding GntR family transcriptional regulator